MKRKLVLLLAIIAWQVIKAQDEQTSEFKLGYGLGTVTEIDALFSDLSIYPASLGTFNFKNRKHSGFIYMGYKYAPIDKLMVGATLGYEKTTADVYLNNVKNGMQTNDEFTFAVEGNYIYISNQNFQMYSGGGIGYTFINQKYSPETKLISDSKKVLVNLPIKLLQLA